MKKYTKLFSAVGVSFTAIGCGYFLNDLINKEKLTASWTTSYEPSVRWDHNWDRYLFVHLLCSCLSSFFYSKYLTSIKRRDPASLVKTKHSASVANVKKEEGQDDKQQLKTVDDFEVGRSKSRASRHLFLIRHGQYEIKAKEADLMVLTPLGIFFFLLFFNKKNFQIHYKTNSIKACTKIKNFSLRILKIQPNFWQLDF